MGTFQRDFGNAQLSLCSCFPVGTSYDGYGLPGGVCFMLKSRFVTGCLWEVKGFPEQSNPAEEAAGTPISIWLDGISGEA